MDARGVKNVTSFGMLPQGVVCYGMFEAPYLFWVVSYLKHFFAAYVSQGCIQIIGLPGWYLRTLCCIIQGRLSQSRDTVISIVETGIQLWCNAFGCIVGYINLSLRSLWVFYSWNLHCRQYGPIRWLDWRPTLTLISPKKAWTHPSIDLQKPSSHMRVGFGRFGFHGFFRKLAWQKSMCSKWLSTEKCMHSHHTKQLRMNTINTIQLLYTIYQAQVNWMNPSNLQYSVTLMDQTFIVTDLPPRMRRLPSGWKLWMVTRSWNGRWNEGTLCSTFWLQCLMFAWSMKRCWWKEWGGLYSWVLSIRAGGGFCIRRPQSLAHWRWIMKLPSNRKCMQEDRCRSCTICCSLGSLLF